ncbi:MAG: hypothetical protein K940chlam1_00498 [Candidatus Anoxychlamydiales bacterium]|nr:hypothetical protein [Candidatus Anoxychlamydiales bacterium]NGX36737.1 hypothetical protein [Candidatus Anoxychlamydiales bacterium]
MISDAELLRLNKEGFIPGPNEDENIFLKRIELSKKMIHDPKSFFENQNQKKPFDFDNRILKPRWNWTRAQLLSLFDIAPSDLAIFYSDQKLHFFQAAATWIVDVTNSNIKIPVLQFRKKLRHKPYLFIYTLDEILAHEAVHSIRVAFDEPKTEEIFSYMTATNVFRKVFGPIIRKDTEVLIFFLLMGLYFCFQILWLFSSFAFFSYFAFLFAISTLVLLTLGLVRLFWVRRKFKKTFKRLFKLLKCKKKARAVLFRLTDEEIFKFAKMKKEAIKDYFDEFKDKSLRLKLIYLGYFK